ncbi:adenylosuccinate synthetase [Ideonella sp. BN130291]|uniref:adenylosuccinate synthetase n=1 Tax=Ideonella sp. BN130291 TaxID=3112940 RepID=UPI002E27744E|nr:adenylosuccinate synthetase [Ideonella sp. BN130291]
MEAPRFASLIDLGFGDCGKGLFTDALCRRWPVHTVVRFNGGAQAGHNVVLPDGRHHTFSQFGSGTFLPAVHTVLAREVVVHPTALLVEEAALQRVGVRDAAERLQIDARCRVTTPYHQAAGRLREWQRGQAAHGSCGVGVGETVRHALQRPEQVLRYGDLLRPALAMQKLVAIRDTLAAEFERYAFRCDEAQALEARVLADDQVGARWLAAAHAVALRVAPASPEAIAQRLGRGGTVLFEGAQGLLLDEWRGFHPHTTWSSVGPAAAQAVLDELGLAGDITQLGLLRSYLCRHGAGPLPTEDAALDTLPEPHNTSDGWQGRFRRGHPDAVLLRYAIDAAGALDGLLVSHMDALGRGAELRWCLSYELMNGPANRSVCVEQGGRVTRLVPSRDADLIHQAALTQLLFRARPSYDEQPVSSAEALLQRIEAITSRPVRFTSNGPTHRHVKARG